MKTKFDRKRLLGIVGLALVLLVAGAGWVQAQTDGVINACVNDSDGTLRIVADGVCRNKEHLLTWNIMGPAGPQGLPGATGATGATGPQGEQGLQGEQGEPGLACWDLNGNGVGDPGEDVKLDGLWDTADCQGPQGIQGEQGPQGETGAAGATGAQGPAGVVERPGFSLRVVDSQVQDFPSYGWNSTSIIIGTDGLPVIAYRTHEPGSDIYTMAVRVAHCSDLACTSATVTTLASGYNVGQSPSITIGADGLPVVVYMLNLTGMDVVHCNDVVCSSASYALLTMAGSVPSITIGVDGLPVIIRGFGWRLRVDHCNDAACSSSTWSLLDIGSDLFLNKESVSIAIGADGLPVISYHDNNGEDLKVAHCADLTCTTASIATLDSAGQVGIYTSIAIGTDGLPVISYLHRDTYDLKVAHCDDLACTTASIATLEDTGEYSYGTSSSTSITIGAEGLPVISYRTSSGALKVAHCSNVSCSSAVLTTVDSGNNLGSYPSITIGADGLPVISYFDKTNETLKVAHCSNAFCTPFVRRR